MSTQKTAFGSRSAAVSVLSSVSVDTRPSPNLMNVRITAGYCIGDHQIAPTLPAFWLALRSWKHIGQSAGGRFQATHVSPPLQ